MTRQISSLVREKNEMTKLLLMLVVVSVWSGCGGDSPTGDEKKELLTWTTTYDDGTVKEEYQYYHHLRCGVFLEMMLQYGMLYLQQYSPYGTGDH